MLNQLYNLQIQKLFTVLLPFEHIQNALDAVLPDDEAPSEKGKKEEAG
jgi:hypothetical protein